MLIFTDASYDSNNKIAGFGYVIITSDREFRAGGFALYCKDNNVAEVGAIAAALKFCQSQKLFQKSNDQTLTILTDSRTAENRINRNFDGSDDLEQGYLKYINYALSRIPMQCRVMQIKGHSDDGSKFSQYNQLADWIASDYLYLGQIEKKSLSTPREVINYPAIKAKKHKGR